MSVARKATQIPHLVSQLQSALRQDSRTSDDVAKLLDVHPVSVRRFRSSGRGLSITSLEKLAKILGYQIIVAKSVTE